MEAVQMDEMDQQQQQQTQGQGPVTLEDVASALGDTDPHHINSAAIRERIGRGSLSTIQKHLYALRQRRSAETEAADREDIEAPEPPKALRGLWDAAYALALSAVHDRLILAQERAAELENIRQGQIEEIEGLAELVDQAEAERDYARAEAKAAREAQREAEAKRDDALKLRDQIMALEQIVALVATRQQ